MVALTLPPSLTFGWARGQDRKSFFRAKKGGEEEQGLPGEFFFRLLFVPKGELWGTGRSPPTSSSLAKAQSTKAVTDAPTPKVRCRVCQARALSRPFHACN